MRRLPPRLIVGSAAILLLALACLVGPVLLPTPPGLDPVRASLLPPGTVTGVVTFPDGSTQVHPGAVSPSEPAAEVHAHRFWLGSDRYGRDVLWHLLHGGRVSLAVASLAAVLALVLGGLVGLTAATGGRVVDAVLMRLVDALLAFPALLLMILAASLIQPGVAVLVTVLGLTSWMGLARLVRGQVMILRERPFILAARAAGSRWHRIALLHYLPNMLGPVSQDMALRLSDLVLAEATLSFLGLGVPPTQPTWGSMVAEGNAMLVHGWWLTLFPGLAIALFVIGLALLGDGLQQVWSVSEEGREEPQPSLSFREPEVAV